MSEHTFVKRKYKKYKYLKDDEALEAFRQQHQGEKYLVNRMKG